MTTTSYLQLQPDYYLSTEECKKKRKIQTNPRYSNFRQTHFTAGDRNQFNEFRDYSNGQICIPNIDFKDNLFRDVSFSDISWNKYKNLNALSVNNTFNYLFNKFKKGIYVKIQNNELKVFLPFSKKNFINEWGNKIKVNPKFKDIYNFAEYINRIGNTNYRININKYTDNWYANNCLIRYEFPLSEGDSNVSNMSDMLKTLCKNRTIPDIEFFINRRDFPQLKRDGTEPYEHIFGDNQPLISHNYEKYCPLMSMVTTENNADIPFPTGEDWARVSSYENKFFDCKTYPNYKEFNSSWKNKIPIAVFRGASTGCGVDIDTNIRLKLAYISALNKNSKTRLLDAGITKWQLRPRILKNEVYLKTIDVPMLNRLGVHLVPFLSPIEQSKYKYIVHVDGHVSAFRLSLELSMGCCILLTDSKYKMWFRKMLQPYVHYVPVKEDLSDLLDQIKWCQENDEKCEKIAENAREFYLKYLEKDGILDYLQKLLFELKKEVGVYLYYMSQPRFSDSLKVSEHKIENKNIYELPKHGRTIGFFKGLELVFTMYGSEIINQLKNQVNLITSTSSTISTCKLLNFNLAIKSPLNLDKNKENIRELFIGVKCVNNIIKYIPNFCYVFGKYEQDNKNYIVIEYIKGKTFSDWLRTSFNIKNYIFILIQLSLALEVAQKHYGFMHNDLTPWNIIIQELNTNVSFDYMIDINNIYRIETNLVPVIIDYGKSTCIYKNKYIGTSLKLSKIQDIISILLSSLDIITQLKISMTDLNFVIGIANFLTGTKYKENPFKISGINGMSDLEYFIKKSKNYDEIIYSSKYELELKRPLDFIDYIQKNIKIQFPLKKIQNASFKLYSGNPVQVFGYILASNVEGRIKSYTDVFEKVLNCEIKMGDDFILNTYLIQTIENNINSVYKQFKIFLNSEKINFESYEALYKKSLERIKNIVSREPGSHRELSLERKEDTNNNLSTFNQFELSLYDEHSFLDPEFILKLIEKYKNYDLNNISSYQIVLENVLINEGEFKLNNDMKKIILNNFQKLLDIPTVNIKNNIANVNSLLILAYKIFIENKSYILAEYKKNDCSSFIDTQRILDIYQKIQYEIKNIIWKDSDNTLLKKNEKKNKKNFKEPTIMTSKNEDKNTGSIPFLFDSSSDEKDDRNEIRKAESSSNNDSSSDSLDDSPSDSLDDSSSDSSDDSSSDEKEEKKEIYDKYLNSEKNTLKINYASKIYIQELIEYLSENKTIHTLSLEGNKEIENKDMKYLSNNSTIINLNLSFTSIGDEGVKYLAENKSIISLNLSNTELGNEGCKYLSNNATITNLDLSYTGIGDEGLKYLAENKSIISLNLTHNEIWGGEGIKYLAENKTIRTLIISEALDINGLKHLSENKTIYTLDVSENELGDEGAKYLAKNKTIHTLYLYRNRIGDEGAKYLSKNKTIHTLILQDNNIGNKGAKYLAKNKTIHTLNLENNGEIGDKGVKYLAENTTIRILNLEDNTEIGDEGYKALAKNKTIKEIKVYDKELYNKWKKYYGIKDLLTYKPDSSKILFDNNDLSNIILEYIETSSEK